MPERIGNVQSVAISAERQIARICPLKLRRSGGNLSNLGESRSWIDTECTHLIVRPIGDVQARASAIEQRFFTVESSFEMTDDGICTGIDYGTEVPVLIEHNYIRTRINRCIQRRNLHTNGTQPAC